MGRAHPETVCAIKPTALQPVPVPSSALLARLAPLTSVPGRPDLVAHHAPDVIALWQAWEEECGAPQAVPFWATVWPAGQLLARVVQAEPAWVRGQDGAGPGLWERGSRHCGPLRGCGPGRGSRHRPGGPGHRRAECPGQCGRAAPTGRPA